MSNKHCPRPLLEKYQAGTSFSGSIISLDVPEKGLFYVLDDNLYEKFQEIEQHEPKASYKKPPKFGEIFFYVNQNRKCYRAYRLNSNPSCFHSIRAFLFDIGTYIYENFKKGSFFKMPESFGQTPPMAIFCYVESFPSCDGEQLLKSDFLKQSIYNTFRYMINRHMQVEDTSKKIKTKCLVVSVLEQDKNAGLEHDDNTVENDTIDLETPEQYDKFWLNMQKTLKIGPKLSYLEGTRLTFMNIALEPNLPQPGRKILVYPTHILKAESIYARCVTEDNLTNELSNETMKLFVWMNSSSVIESYQKLQTKPEEGEMVIAIGLDGHFHRGCVVSSSANDSFPIFFIDFGHTTRIDFKDLYKFPREFAKVPAQAVLLKIINASTCENIDSVKTTEIMENFLGTNGIADVISSSYDGMQPSLSVKLYNDNGSDLSNYIQENAELQTCKSNYLN